jgi:8-oxo-dGTP pyrophosphatase MutT (NUDIX family)
MENMAAPVAVPRLAAAILLLRPSETDGGFEVFMVRRDARNTFAPDVFVFPGGSVSQDDCEAEVTPGICVPIQTITEATALGTGVRVAAIRELFEEAGVLLALRDDKPLVIAPNETTRFLEYRHTLQKNTLPIAELAAAEDIVLATDALIHCAHWITPEAAPKRFDTHFFLAEHPSGQQAAHDARETTQGVWIRPAQALEDHRAGKFPLVFATVQHLRMLSIYASATAALNDWRGKVPPTILPRIVRRNGEEVILLPDEPGIAP